ncbi:hypothetical protein MYX06_00210 [Patescibacteria group bacterium AH-259-L05]|nr:hypothetical protein [Patescibacteria group bacterium AH-259-L05]
MKLILCVSAAWIGFVGFIASLVLFGFGYVDIDPQLGSSIMLSCTWLTTVSAVVGLFKP